MWGVLVNDLLFLLELIGIVFDEYVWFLLN